MAKRVTLSEIGRRAGVSSVAASAALGLLSENSSVRLSEAKAKQIRQVAKELGYQPDLLARAFRRQRTYMVGVLFRVVSNPLPISYLIDCMHRELLAQEYHAYLSPFQSTFDVLEESVRDLLAWRVEGMILSHVFQSDDREHEGTRLEAMLEQIKVPLVLVESDFEPERPCSQVFVDHGDSMRRAAAHLLKLGHRALAFVPDRRGPAPERWAGLEAAVAAWPGASLEHVHLAKDDSVFAVQRLVHEARLTGRSIAAMPARPTGLVCHNDMVAAGVIAGLRDCGLRVPADCSVIGYDNSDLAVLTDPELTSFDPPMERLAAAAVTELLRQIEQPRCKPRRHRFKAELRVRASTAPPPAERRPARPPTSTTTATATTTTPTTTPTTSAPSARKTKRRTKRQARP